ncbi:MULTISPECIES: polysaccharide biosynthesis/export family protein [Parabacteroides]|uniref:polysaccharide biosynthesis/export family protein n=1 Tax=Parabacteroides TaxID=375288 RepID=UPI000EFF12EA|nr:MULTISPECIES: polysaccharide biosynthesis/export family protein [Parabacteroides]RHU24798.1 polysaccharide export protein [Parabacteroides sp. TM07-1AC]WFE83087.1 polysaccharide biosynthesis/export family protein [Parabacteroides chongii]
MKLKYWLFVCLFGFMCACKAPQDVVYFQGIDELTPEQLIEMSQTYTTKISNDDLLSINVTAWDPAAVTPFNPPVFAYSVVPQGEQPIASSQNLYTYLVDQDGNINFPVLGKVHVAGLTRQEVAGKLEEMISKYVENPLVNVQLLNFKITMMGDVSRPGTLAIKNDRVSILDAIGMAGDLQLSANRKNILVIRDNNGVKETYRMDITDPGIFASPCFYLKQNDIVYVEPIRIKQRSRTSSDRSFTMSLLTSVISSVSIITSMVITIVNLNRK